MPKKNTMQTVAIIEDDAILSKALSEELQDAGYATIVATNGKEGLALVTTKHPDLILLDIIMPEMDGITMLNELRKDSWGSDVPVIILTNLSEPTTIATAINQAAFDYLVKSSWELKDIVEKVDDKLKR